MSLSFSSAQIALGQSAGERYRTLSITSRTMLSALAAKRGRGMRRGAIVFLLCAGCSTAPIADVLDYFKPGKLEPAQAAPYGGVCLPRPVCPPAPGAVILPPGASPAGPALPGPAPSTAPGTLPPQGTPLPPPDFGGALTPIPATPPSGVQPLAGELPPVNTTPPP
jgi:hypothetical protein